MVAGSREFIAYARTVQRTHWAKELERSTEALVASHYRIEMAEALFGQLASAAAAGPRRPPARKLRSED
jgi:hypothetical protein